MLKNLCLKALEYKLTTAKVTFFQDGNHLKLHFNNYSNPFEFSHDLVSFQNDFSKEFFLNLSVLNTQESKSNYLKFVKQVFVACIDKLGGNLNILAPQCIKGTHVNKDPYNILNEISDLFDLISFFTTQKNIIIESIKLVERNCLIIDDDHTIQNNFSNYWKDFKIDFYPYISRFRNELSNVTSLPEKIKQVNVVREKIANELLLKGIDLYDSPLNMYFEAWLFSLKDSYLSFLNNPNLGRTSLHWKAQTVDFLELILALDQSQCLSLEDGCPVSRKELISQLSAFFNIGPISNYESRLHKFKTRTNKTPFLDKLKEVFILFTDGDKIK